ncbi:hypothetical protein ZWY2020_025077 [Hordeum vulgare]|nr:hypothetical protein ZWY2020_025077 [Hordeum vulgare]
MTRFGIATRFNATSSVVLEAAAAASTGAVHAVPRTKPVVSAEWLHANLRDPDVTTLTKVLRRWWNKAWSRCELKSPLLQMLEVGLEIALIEVVLLLAS